MVDRFGRLIVMRIAAASSVLMMIVMSVTHGTIVSGLLVGVRSVVLIFYMTAQFAYASNIVSRERAVSAAGTMGIIGNIAFASGRRWVFIFGSMASVVNNIFMPRSSIYWEQLCCFFCRQSMMSVRLGRRVGALSFGWPGCRQ